MTANTMLWIVAKIHTQEETKEYQGHTWDLIGVCENEQLAIDACLDETYCIGPMELNKILPSTMVEWEDAYYPRGCEDCGGPGYSQPCPYAQELFGEDTPHILCDDCAYQRAMDV